tara:strand:- start:59 stop:361 length:303 start_codon:yes stop_codon:yes gene_type:complete
MKLFRRRKEKNALIMESKREVRNAVFLLLLLIANCIGIIVLMVLGLLNRNNILLLIPLIHFIKINSRNLLIKRSVLNFKRYLLDAEFRRKYDKGKKITYK